MYIFMYTVVVGLSFFRMLGDDDTVDQLQEG